MVLLCFVFPIAIRRALLTVVLLGAMHLPQMPTELLVTISEGNHPLRSAPCSQPREPTKRAAPRLVGETTSAQWQLLVTT